MTNNKAKVYTLKIAGRDITLSSNDPPELVHRVSVYADRKISESSAGGLISRELSPVIACLSLAEELLNAQDDNTRLRRELWEAKKELEKARSTEEKQGE